MNHFNVPPSLVVQAVSNGCHLANGERRGNYLTTTFTHLVHYILDRITHLMGLFFDHLMPVKSISMCYAMDLHELPCMKIVYNRVHPFKCVFSFER